MSKFLNVEIKLSIYQQVQEMLKYLEFVECVEQINCRYPHYEQIGFAISCLIIQTKKVNIQ